MARRWSEWAPSAGSLAPAGRLACQSWPEAEPVCRGTSLVAQATPGLATAICPAWPARSHLRSGRRLGRRGLGLHWGVSVGGHALAGVSALTLARLASDELKALPTDSALAAVAGAGFFCILGAMASARVMSELIDFSDNDEWIELASKTRQLRG